MHAIAKKKAKSQPKAATKVKSLLAPMSDDDSDPCIMKRPALKRPAADIAADMPAATKTKDKSADTTKVKQESAGSAKVKKELAKMTVKPAKKEARG